MITVDIRGMDSVRAALQGASAQMPYAISSAINSTAFVVMQKERAEMKRVFDRPTPWIVSQVRVTQATKQNLTATVSFNSAKSDAIMTPHVFPGVRGYKPYELVLRGMGVLPSGMKCVPSDVIQTSASGDPTKGTISKIINGLKTQGSGYFVIKTAGKRLHPGIWLKTKRGQVKPQFLFVSQASYRKRFEFAEVGAEEVRRTFAVNFEKAWAKALATAR